MENTTAVQFNNYMMRGNVKSTVRLLSTIKYRYTFPLVQKLCMSSIRNIRPDASYDEMLLIGSIN